MGRRLGTVAIFAVMLAAGALLWSAVAQWWTSPTAAAAPEADTLGRVRVEVRNAGGRSGMAHTATNTLRDLGFDVVYFGNADHFGRDSTVVIDRVGRIEKARAVADALGVMRVVSEPDSNLYLDVTVLLGAEWDLRPASDPGTSELPWWSLGRWRRGSEPEENESGNEG